jgi:hypothetical protein
MILRTAAGVGACLLATMVSVPSGAATTPGWRITSTYGAPLYAAPQGIAAVSANDAWISGNTGPLLSLLIQRWTNGKWQTLPDPAGFTGTDSSSVNDRIINASSLTNVWTFPNVSTSTGITQYGLGWNGHAWSKLTFKGVQVLNAAAFSPSDVWMFGSKISSKPILGYGSPYVVRYNGHAWKSAPTPPGVVLGVDKLSANDIWAYGPTTKTAGGVGTSWAYIAMRWNGTKWQTVARNSTLYPDGGGLAYDGHGGFWIPGAGSAGSAPEYLVHYSGGHALLKYGP